LACANATAFIVEHLFSIVCPFIPTGMQTNPITSSTAPRILPPQVNY
jgi:hypothetical protein